MGSSPRMRGTRPIDVSGYVFCKDHPRGCGEHTEQSPRPTRHHGSSPRMRGTRFKFVHNHHFNRIIPADAGNTDWRIENISLYRDHPRGCGEHVNRTDKQHIRVGIIPADAGNTMGSYNPCLASPDHPRGCGEHESLNTAMKSLSGSSPRMRGTR